MPNALGTDKGHPIAVSTLIKESGQHGTKLSSLQTSLHEFLVLCTKSMYITSTFYNCDATKVPNIHTSATNEAAQKLALHHAVFHFHQVDLRLFSNSLLDGTLAPNKSIDYQ